VFTPKGEVKSLAAGATPLDFAYEVHTESATAASAPVNGKIVPLHYELRSGDIVEILTSKRERGPSRDWLAMVKTTRARNKIKAVVQGRVAPGHRAHRARAAAGAPAQAGLPAQKITGSPLLADVIREMGYRKADDFYIALGGAKISPKVVVNKVMQRLKQGEAAEASRPRRRLLRVGRRAGARRPPPGSTGSGSRASTR
jgi:guanosine-3',5'-bis(diphosphate) 3'-pyrophosphohydrolase